jgi:hypothetical protein
MIDKFGGNQEHTAAVKLKLPKYAVVVSTKFLMPEGI